MTTIPYTPPTFHEKSYNCPYCNAYAEQKWLGLYEPIAATQSDHRFVTESKDYFMSMCSRCSTAAMWHEGVMVIPDVSSAQMAHPDLPETLLADFEEARSVFSRSPRSSAALLRLTIQKLCVELGQKGKNINDDIAALVADGLPVRVQQALDIVRVIGNEQVHPGQFDVRDNPAMAAELFRLVNFIVEDRISRPKAIQELYDRLPTEKREAIEKRDSK